jgi:hypothetical protein
MKVKKLNNLSKWLYSVCQYDIYWYFDILIYIKYLDFNK